MTIVALPHSGTHGSPRARRSPWHFAVRRALHRPLAPRHPPAALGSLLTQSVRSRSRVRKRLGRRLLRCLVVGKQLPLLAVPPPPDGGTQPFRFSVPVPRRLQAPGPGALHIHHSAVFKVPGTDETTAARSGSTSWTVAASVGRQQRWLSVPGCAAPREGQLPSDGRRMPLP